MYHLTTPFHLTEIEAGTGRCCCSRACAAAQTEVPGQLLGRVVIFMRVITWSTASLGALLGGLAIECTHNMILVYAALGLHIIGIALALFATPLGRTDSTEAQAEQHKTSE